ncbi:hypothetical protein FRC02_008109 [Tulasnella sp. 418]|nr:hypothetical protein FRC02_008109 [Tulasnella sp. 418]
MSLLGFLSQRPDSRASTKVEEEKVPHVVDQSPPLTPSLTSSSTESSDPPGAVSPAPVAEDAVARDSSEYKSRPLPIPQVSPGNSNPAPRERPPRQGRPTSLTRPLSVNLGAPLSQGHHDGPPTAFKYKPRRRTSSINLLWDDNGSYLTALCTKPAILGALLAYLEFSDFHSITCTSRSMRQLLDDPRTRDVVLARFVPSYRSSYGRRLDGIQVSMSDLELLIMSQFTPLHLYPMHALRIISGAPMTSLTTQLEAFTQVHSRFVMLLRSRAPPAAPADTDDIQWRTPGVSEVGTVRQISFPAPLSYFPPTPPASPKENRRNKKQRRTTSIFCLFTKPAKDVDEQSHAVLSSSTRSFFRTVRKPRVPPPPPERVPSALRQHRHSRMMSTSLSVSARRGKTPMSMLMELEEEDSAVFTPPRPSHLRSNSLPSSPASNSSNSLQKTPTGRSSSLGGFTGNPHDIAMSSLRSRAPILRVFVPCEQLSPSAIIACEGQLMAAGLWEYLNVGDIVSNFGYVPRPDPNTTLESQSLESRGWLLYTGTSLIPYDPAIPPDFNALLLSSPLYFSHILPPFINPRFTLRIPVNKTGMRREPELTLTQMAVSTRSPATRTGVVMVNKFVWYGKLDGAELFQSLGAESPVRGRTDRNNRASRYELDEKGSSFFNGTEVGEGWMTEWVVEAEGTKEGRKELYFALNPFEEVNTEWELVRERCSPSRIWLRYTPAFIPSGSTEEDASF